MILLAVTPLCVNDDELTRRQKRYDRLSPVGIEVKLVNLGTGADIPRALNTVEEIEASEAALLEKFRDAEATNRYGNFDGFLPDCVLDPVVGIPNTGLTSPIYGLLKLTSHFLHGLGATVGAVARNEAIARELDRKYESYGLGSLNEQTSILGLSVVDIADDELWAATVTGHLKTMESKFVINGCSAVEVSEPRGSSVLVDPTATALHLLGTGAEMGMLSR